jgi:hypothetical protein
MSLHSFHGHPCVRLAPRLEVLEDRCLPSCTTQVSGGVLTILGDARANDIRITDNGTNGAGSLTVQCDGVVRSFNGIAKIVVNSREGADHVEYRLTGDLTVSREIDVNLGAGDDVFLSNWFGSVRSGVQLTLDVDGKAGKDLIAVDATNGVNIAPQAEVDVNLNGGLGADRIFMDHRGKLDGTLDGLFTGGLGTDTIAVTADLAANSAGQLLAKVDGNAGNDDLTLQVNQAPGGLAVVQAGIDGGAGHDLCHRTPNVAAVNCE